MCLNIEIRIRDLGGRIQSDSVSGEIGPLSALQVRIGFQACEQHRIHAVEQRACLQQHLFPAVHLIFLVIQGKGRGLFVSEHSSQAIRDRLIYAVSVIVNTFLCAPLPLCPQEVLFMAELLPARLRALQFPANAAVDPAIFLDPLGILVLAVLLLLDLHHHSSSGLLEKSGQTLQLPGELLRIAGKRPVQVRSNSFQFHCILPVKTLSDTLLWPILLYNRLISDEIKKPPGNRHLLPGGIKPLFSIQYSLSPVAKDRPHQRPLRSL